jgi:hypothetical protein
MATFLITLPGLISSVRFIWISIKNREDKSIALENIPPAYLASAKEAKLIATQNTSDLRQAFQRLSTFVGHTAVVNVLLNDTSPHLGSRERSHCNRTPDVSHA